MSLETHPRRDHSGGAGALVQRLARRIGYTPATMSQKLWGPQRLNLQVVEVIHECRRGAQDELLYRWLKPILDAYSSTEAPPLVPATWNLEQEADAHEDIAELAYTLEPTDVNLDRLIRALDRQVLRSTALRDALVVEQQRRRSHGA